MKHLKKYLILFLAAFVLLASCARSGGKNDGQAPAYPDPALSPEERAEILLSRMDLDDKVGQMTQVARDYLNSPDDIRYYRLGSVLSGGGSAPSPNSVEAWRDMTDGMQAKALETPFAIPLLYGSDAVHGHGNLLNAVIFPHHIGLGAANNPELVEEIARITTHEAAATGVRWNFNPCLTVPQDIRWGRTYEGFSSDPAIVSILGAAETRGIQSALGSPSAVIASLKHFVADGGTEGGVDRGDALIDEEILKKIHLAPYLPSLEAGALSVMASFSSINGMMMHENGDLLTGLLKEELGFNGFVVSDWAALKLLPGNSKEQIEAAINAGIDMVMVPDNYQSFIRDLKWLVDKSRVSMERIDDAVYRILKVKFEMGLFEFPYADPSLESAVGGDEHRKVARQAVAESQVLLKNEGILPLSKESRILVVGSYADDIGAQSGGWTLEWQGKLGNDNEGTSIVEALELYAAKENIKHIKSVYEIPENASSEYDVAVLVTGEKPYAEMEGDNPRPSIPESAVNAADRLSAEGLPVLSIILSGRPLLLDGLEKTSHALVASWLPGTEGDGIADVLFGEMPFRGKLSFSWPADERGLVQGLDQKEYLYPLGYGLTLDSE